MTPSEELALLEAGYTTWITAGCPQSYSIGGRAVTKVDAAWWTRRIDQLRAQVARQTTGIFSAAQFRNPE